MLKICQIEAVVDRSVLQSAAMNDDMNRMSLDSGKIDEDTFFVPAVRFLSAMAQAEENQAP